MSNLVYLNIYKQGKRAVDISVDMARSSNISSLTPKSHAKVMRRNAFLCNLYMIKY